MPKKCSKCGIDREDIEFCPKDNIKSACKACNKINKAMLNKQYRESHKRELYEYKKTYVENNKEAITNYNKEYQEKNKERLLQNRKARYESNKEKILLQRKVYYENNKHLVKERVKLYAKTEIGIRVRKTAMIKYYHSKPKKKLEYGIRHFITFVIKPKILFRDNYSCQLCGCKDKDFHCHHIIPVSIAPDKMEDPANLITLCQTCHIKAHKGDWQKIDFEIQTLLLENKNLQKELQWEN